MKGIVKLNFIDCVPWYFGFAEDGGLGFPYNPTSRFRTRRGLDFPCKLLNILNIFRDHISQGTSFEAYFCFFSLIPSWFTFWRRNLAASCGKLRQVAVHKNV